MSDGPLDLQFMIDRINALPEKVQTATIMYGQNAAAKLQQEAQLHRPWTDRTAQARQRLRGSVEARPDKDGVTITLSHGVDYGIHLEYGHEKRFAIIAPTIRKHSKEIYNGWKQMVDKL